jgi:hypothetical protein
MKLIDIIKESEESEESIVKKGDNVYKFLKKGTFTLRINNSEHNKYRYILPDKYQVYTNKNLSDGVYPIVTITPEHGMRDNDMKILFEPLDDDSLMIYRNNRGEVYRLFKSFLERKFLKYRVKLSGRIMINVMYNGNDAN